MTQITIIQRGTPHNKVASDTNEVRHGKGGGGGLIGGVEDVAGDLILGLEDFVGGHISKQVECPKAKFCP